MLFDPNIEPLCAYCQYATDIGAAEVICIRRGIMDSNGSCVGFRYEPTKRVPQDIPCFKPSRLTEEDFAIQ